MTDDLPDLTVDEQEDELQNLSKTELKELREDEERQTAIDNIDSELSSRQAQEDEMSNDPEQDVVEDDQEPVEQEETKPEDTEKADNRSELERKVDYLIERCKTTSHQGFEEYDN